MQVFQGGFLLTLAKSLEEVLLKKKKSKKEKKNRNGSGIVRRNANRVVLRNDTF